MLALLLIEKIVSLFLVMICGMVIVRCKILSSKESRILSLLMLYLIMPCMILTAFQVERTHEVTGGLMATMRLIVVPLLTPAVLRLSGPP